MQKRSAILLLVIVGCLFLAACQNPIDTCLEDKDCTLVRRDVRTSECCVWVAINVSLVQWYTPRAEKMVCPMDCPLLPPVKPVCREGHCKVEMVN